MSDVFISYAEEDRAVAARIASALEDEGYGVWYYERDALPGTSYLIQIGQAIDSCKAIVLLISPDSIASHQVTTEVIRGHEAAKPFVPVLIDLSHTEFQKRQPEWREVVGARASVRVPKKGIGGVLPKLVAGVAILVGPAEVAPVTHARIGTRPPRGKADAGNVLEAEPVRHVLNQPFGEESCEYELALLQEDYPAYYFEEAPFNGEAIDPGTYLIVGRRGCGKTSLAHYFAFQDSLGRAECIDVSDARRFELLLGIAERVFYASNMPVPRLVAIWEMFIFGLVFEEYRESHEAIRKALRNDIAGSETLLRRASTEDLEPFLEQLETFRASSDFESAQAALLQACQSTPVIVAIDTLEKYDRTNQPLMALTAALVEAASNFNLLLSARGLHVKAFFSAEVFPHIKESAVSNTSKYIRNELYLTWRPKDLMRLVCWRLDGFLRQRDTLPTKYESEVDWRNFDEVLARRWAPYFSEELTNEFGQSEGSFPYVLRHTQMRPRQLVILCNQIARVAIRSGQFPQMRGECIVDAIRGGQSRLADEVLNSYSEIYPGVALIIDALRGLPMRFTGNLLDKVARKTASEWQGEYSPSNFKRLVSELGIVGIERKHAPGSNIVEADFEYSLEERLPISSHSTCVIHPMFHAKLNIDTSEGLIVLPFPDRQAYAALV